MTDFTIYGVRLDPTTGSDRATIFRFPDEDNEILLGIGGGNYVSADSVAALRASVVGYNRANLEGYKATLVQVTPDAIAEDVPTVTGSVIRATVDGRRGLFALSGDTDDMPWCALAEDARRRWIRPAELTGVEILFVPEVSA